MITNHRLADDYLGRLQAAAAVLPAERADELVADIREHLASAIAPGSSEADVRNILDGLGTPQELVAAARDELPPTGSAVPVKRPVRWIEPTALALAGAAAVLFWFPFLSIPLWAAWVALLLIAPRWTWVDKVFGLTIAALPALLIGMGTVAYRETCTTVDGATVCTGGPPMLGPVPVGAIVAVAWVAVALYALVRLLRRLR